MRKTIPLILILMATFPPFPLRGDPLSFPDALRTMTESNEELHAARAEVDSKRYERYAAYGLFLPVVNIGYMYTHLNDDLSLDINQIRDTIITFHTPPLGSNVPGYSAAQLRGMLGDWEKTMQEQDFWSLSASLKWPIWTGGKILAANRAANARLDEAGEKYRYTRGKLTSELVERYFGYRLALKVIEVRNEVLLGMEKHLAEAMALEESGMIAHAERLHAEVSRSEAERELKKSRRDAEIAATGLKNTLNSPYDCVPTTPLFVVNGIEDMEVFRKTALANNPVLRQVEANRQLVHQAYMKELSRYSPDIYVFGNRELAGRNRSMTSPEWYIGFGASMTLFDGLNRYNSLMAADYTQDRVMMMEKKAKSDISALVEKCYNEMMKNREQLQSLDSALAFATEYLRVREKAFQEGLATSTDLVDAQLNLSRVKIERLKALYEFDVSLARLLEVCGISEQIDRYRIQGIPEVES